MEIKVTKLTNESLVRMACEATMRGQKSKVSLNKMYKCEHSPIRTQLFWVEMQDIYTFVSVHFVRHKIGCEHYIMSNREDRGGTGKEDRYTPINHSMLINAQALIQMSRKRLCGAAHIEAQKTMQAIKDAIEKVDPDLAQYMVRECQYRNGICPELKCCGNLFSYK